MEVTEYKSRRLRLKNEDLRYLLSLVSGVAGSSDARVIRSLTPTEDAGTYLVTPGPFVGRLGLPSGEWIEFRSRFAFADLTQLILRSGRLPVLVDRLPAAAGREPFLVDLLAVAYARELDLLLSRGLAKGYQPFQSNRPPYGGRIDVNRHVSRLAGRPDLLPTVARRITTDVGDNQILAAALDVLTRTPLTGHARDRVAALVPALRRVSRARPAEVLRPRAAESQTPKRYLPALALASIILRARTVAPRGSDEAGASMLFYMPKIWESHVTSWLRAQWPNHRVEAPYSFQLTHEGGRAEADATVWSDGRLVGLYDAKYKWPDAAPDRADVYQMVTYCERLQVSEATLVYPATAPPKSLRVGDKVVRVLGLSVSLTAGSAEVVS